MVSVRSPKPTTKADIYDMLRTVIINLFICLSVCNQSKSQDIYGVVSVRNVTDPYEPEFSVTSNDEGGFITVYLVAVNDTANGPVYQSDVEIDESVLVSCTTITPFTPGDSIIDFEDAVVPRGVLQADVSFSVTEQGRAVEVQCAGESTSTPGDGTSYFNLTTSQGPTGFVVVKKSPIVSFCDPVVQVPYAEGITTGTVNLKLSEPVELYDVIVSCRIVAVVDANSSLWVTFDDKIVSPGMDTVMMQYTIRRYGSIALVSCTANSTIGDQFLASTSAGEEATFLLDSGSVQLVPTVSNVHTPTFSAFLVLSDALQPNEGEITFACYLIPVNTTEFARETIDNPSCVFPDPSEGVTQAPPIATPCPADNNSTCPTTQASPVSDSLNLTQASPWTLLTSEFVFQEGDVYKEVKAQLKSLYGSHEGALVLTCCAAYDVNSSPKYTNASAALVILSEVKPIRPVNASQVPGVTVGSQETDIPNPAYIEVSPCPCDLYDSECDVDCCCDKDCSEDEVNLFTCTEGIQGGNFSALPNYFCESTSLYRPDWWPFLCVHLSNSPHLGLYYSTPVGLKDVSSFNNLKAQAVTATTTSFEDSLSRELNFEENSGSIGYQNGYPIELTYDANLRGYLTLPMVAIQGNCHYSSIVRFQTDSSSECTKTFQPSSCADYTPFSARTYLQPSATSYPACPVVPRVIAEYGRATTANTRVKYLCLDGGIESYLRSSSRSPLNATQTELFEKSAGLNEEDEEVTATRCEWDDGFSVPLVPTLNNVTKNCDNVVLDVDYQLFWRGGQITSIEATILLGSVPLPDTVSVPESDDDTIFITPPAFPETETTTVSANSTASSQDFSDSLITVTDVITDFDEFLMSLGTDETSSPVMSSLTEGRTTPVPTTQMLTTSPVASSPPTTPGLPTTVRPTPPENVTSSSNATGPPLPLTTLSPAENGTDSFITEGNTTLTRVRVITQRFRATFTHSPVSVEDPLRSFNETGPVQTPRSGNPGYNTGATILSGVAMYDIVGTLSTPTPVNCTTDPLNILCNETTEDGMVFTNVDVDDGNRLQMISPGVRGLCSEAGTQEILFGVDMLSGCFLRLSISELSNCTELRRYVRENLRAFMPSDMIGKTGTANTSQEGDWAAIFIEDGDIEESPSPDPTGESVTTTPRQSTESPNQTYVQDPAPPQILDQLTGICFDVPTGINLEILITDAGEYNGFTIQEIVTARIRYTSSVLKMNCAGADSVRCQTTSTTGVDDEYVQSFMVTASVTYTKVPPKAPEPVILYFKNYDPSVCKQRSCWSGIFYPFTESFEGDAFEYTLAVTMITVLVTTAYLIVTKPWLGLNLI